MTSPGEVLIDRYRLVQRLGNGAMGTVWEAFDTTLERRVAVKELIADPKGGEPLEIRLKRVHREALALARVEHPVIVTIHDLIYARSKKDPWIVMGYAHGRSLDNIIEDAPLGDRQAASIGLAVLEGLMACHRRSVYHRDVKPANIVVSADGSVHLVDFGIVQMAGKESLTAPSSVVGTPSFLAPELLKGRPPGPATDLWALAVTLFCARTGTPPFEAGTIDAVYTAILSAEPRVPIPRGPLGGLLMRILTKREPDERPDGEAMAADLRRILGGGGHVGSTYRPGPDWDAKRGDADSRGEGNAWRQQPEQPERRGDTQPIRPWPVLTALSGMPAPKAADLIAGWPADQATTELRKLGEREAADIIKSCDDLLGGQLLSGMAADDPARVRKILDMVLLDRAGQLLEQMSPVASAAALSRPPFDKAARILERADTRTAAEILSQVSPADRRQALLSALPSARRALVSRYL